MTWLDRQKRGALAAYRNGIAKRTMQYREASVITGPAPQHGRHVGVDLGDGCARTGRLPTADEQVFGEDSDET